MANRIHLYERKRLIEQVPGSPGECTSGYWVISDETATALIGGEILFHESQKAPSFMGGTILSYERSDAYEGEDRVVFRFRVDPALANIETDPNTWDREKKILLEP